VALAFLGSLPSLKASVGKSIESKAIASSYSPPSTDYSGPDDSYKGPSDSYNRPNMPDNSYKIPNDRYTSPNGRYKAAEDSYTIPEDSYTRPKDSYTRPKNSYTKPEDSYTKPEDRYTRPEDSYTRTEDGYTRPEDSYTRPENSYTRPEDSYARPDDSFTRPVKVESNIRNTRPGVKYSRPGDIYEGSVESYGKPSETYRRLEKPTDNYRVPSALSSTYQVPQAEYEAEESIAQEQVIPAQSYGVPLGDVVSFFDSGAGLPSVEQPLEQYNDLSVYQGSSNSDDDEGNSLKMLMNVIPGVPGQDYPILSIIPDTTFSCQGKVSGGYYADPTADCQVFHICSRKTGFHSFLCPNGTIFHQAYLTCDFWYNSDCSKAKGQYGINDQIQAEREQIDRRNDQASYKNNDEATNKNNAQASFKNNDQATYKNNDQETYKNNNQATYKKSDQATYKNNDLATYKNNDQARYKASQLDTLPKYNRVGVGMYGRQAKSLEIEMVSLTTSRPDHAASKRKRQLGLPARQASKYSWASCA